jgi:hypothetical protein
MGSRNRVKLVVVVMAAIVAGTFLLAGAAVGKKPRPKKSYTSSGNGTYESTGQACFGAKWAGTGGWSTSYKRTEIETNVGTTTDTFSGDDSYSWDESAVEAGADCGLSLLKGYKSSGGAFWNRGYVRGETKGNRVQTFPQDSPPTITTPCYKSGHYRAGGSMVLKSQAGSSFVFEITVEAPGGCDTSPPGIAPGSAVPGGKVRGDFDESTSVKVPKTVFEHARTVAITISSDPAHGPLPNCGVEPATYVSSGATTTVKCTQTGAWQGTLTLYEG